MAETAPKYDNLTEVPTPWQKLEGGRLSLEQVNGLMERAYALGSTGKPAYGDAQREFLGLHEQQDGLWVRKASN